jgi:hypothetical protein
MLRCKNCGHEVRLPSKRSDSQNAFYWLYLGIIERDTGQNADDIHEWAKRKFLPPRFIKVNGEEMRIAGTTTGLGKGDFVDFMDKIAAETNVPIPNPEDAGFISNTKPPVT